MTTFFASAEDAENAFYEAIARADLDALMNVWADDEEIVCIHPTGVSLCGLTAIRESWRTIFANNPRLTVRITRRIAWSGMLLTVHNLTETLYLANEPTPHGPMLATNVFQRGAKGWRLLSHHSSAAAADAPEAANRDGGAGMAARTLH